MLSLVCKHDKKTLNVLTEYTSNRTLGGSRGWLKGPLGKTKSQNEEKLAGQAKKKQNKKPGPPP